MNRHVDDIKPKKTYFNGWCRYGYEVKSEDLMKYHWNNKCSKAKIENGYAGLILTPNKSKNIIPIKPMKIKDSTPSLIRNLWNDRSNMPNISSRTTLGDLVEAYFNSVQTNVGRK
ncbi:hypothetical protein C1645_828030 [Glomus cerebriforme]|uniref:Uncharacterized protein n=1 Tax=Glomus cerebriforme TaxID=658196 RepID=A0A397SMC7_9GLOM|nr:hypothetical protein C1645_828030 [Glomus cerebriforme]